ncbi:MAG: transposase [Caldilineae bacterium]|nr:MAG: transposase [Caldilineae bacterium]
MMPLHPAIHVYLVAGPTDMRKAIDGLALLVADGLHLDPMSGHLFVFCNRKRDIIKILYWDHNGFCLWQKRLERQRFPWPQSTDATMKIGVRELRWILDGLPIHKINGHYRENYTRIS